MSDATIAADNREKRAVKRKEKRAPLKELEIWCRNIHFTLMPT